MLSFEDVKQQTSITGFCEEHLEKKNHTFICPFCNSGKGENATPALKLYEASQSFTCFSCNTSGDIYHIAGAVLNTEDRIKNEKQLLKKKIRKPNFIKNKKNTLKHGMLYNLLY